MSLGFRGRRTSDTPNSPYLRTIHDSGVRLCTFQDKQSDIVTDRHTPEVFPVSDPLTYLFLSTCPPPELVLGVT